MSNSKTIGFTISSLSPLDGKYLSKVSELQEYLSESALMKYRIQVEVRYVLELVSFLSVVEVSKKEANRLIKWSELVEHKGYMRIKEIEGEIKHDVKAVEYFIRENLEKLKLKKLAPWIHWGVTSNDINNLAYGLMLQHAKDSILIPAELKVLEKLAKMAEKYKSTVMPARTHGQLAVPTTVGKEMIVFASRAKFFLEKIIDFKFGGKLNGAVGNLNAHQKIYPEKNWLKFSRNFIEQLGLDPTEVTTQIEPYAKLVWFLDGLRQVNNVWLDLANDMWIYIAFDYMLQKVVKKEVGSSTMPHKVNPINCENAEGNIAIANGILITMSNKLPVSRMQRDLSDSTVRRNFGVAFGHSLLVTKSLLQGLEKVVPNEILLKKEINKHPEMMTEALQLKLKQWGVDNAYEKIKKSVRGKKVTWEEIINMMEISDEKKKILNKWDPETYIGLAEEITSKENSQIFKFLNKYK